VGGFKIWQSTGRLGTNNLRTLDLVRCNDVRELDKLRYRLKRVSSAEVPSNVREF
jgi:hypothetical protein